MWWITKVDERLAHLPHPPLHPTPSPTPSPHPPHVCMCLYICTHVDTEAAWILDILRFLETVPVTSRQHLTPSKLPIISLSPCLHVLLLIPLIWEENSERNYSITSSLRTREGQSKHMRNGLLWSSFSSSLINKARPTGASSHNQMYSNEAARQFGFNQFASWQHEANM